MHIAIDGLDGAGKTTAAREVARRLGFSYVEKPLSAVSDPEGGLQEYLRFTSYINLHTDLEFRAMIYGAGTYLAALRARTENIVSDRYICSMYAINATGENETFLTILSKLRVSLNLQWCFLRMLRHAACGSSDEILRILISEG